MTTRSDHAQPGRACCGELAGGLDPASAERSASVLKALAHPVRLRLVSAIRTASGAEACVCDLQEVVGLSQSTVSHHLRLLVEAGLLRREKRGQWSWYTLDEGAWRAVGELFA
ncbi:ArsR/SmtB family transcription factor [Kytococcus sp. Marseille-QA3725]